MAEPSHVRQALNELASSGPDLERAKAARKRLAAAGVNPDAVETGDEASEPAARSTPPQGRRARTASTAD